MRRIIWLIIGYLPTVGVVLWMAGNGLVMSWAGNRPLQPDALHPFLYRNHGVMYVSASDLLWSRSLLISGSALVLVGWIALYVREELAKPPGRRWHIGKAGSPPHSAGSRAGRR